MKRRILWIIAALACAAILTVLLAAPPAQTPQPGAALLQAAEGLDEITIDAVLDPDAQTVCVTQTFSLVNRTGGNRDDLVLRTYAAAFRSEDYSPSATEELHSACYPDGFSAGGIDITSDDLRYTYDDEAQTVLRIPLDPVWKSGGTLRLTLRYALSLPDAAYRFGVSGGVYTLGNAFVIPAVYQDGAWRTDAYYSVGDPFLSECRNYTVRLTLPPGYTAAGTGAMETDGAVTTFTAPASRDIAVCISKSYQTASAVQDGVLLKAYAKTAAHASAMLAAAKGAMQVYTKLYGAYPYPTFTLAEADLPFDGVCYPGLAMIDSEVLQQTAQAREIIIAREVARQWFEAVVGTDGFYQAWQHEALSEYALLAYWGARHGASARESLQYSHVDTAMRLTVDENLTPGSPLDYFFSWTAYQTVARYRGAAALCALELALDGRLDEFLAAYYDTYAFSIAERTDFEQALRTFSGEDWTPLLEDYLDTIY